MKRERIPIQGPLNGINVIDFANYTAAPSAAKILASWGANVVRVQTTGTVPGYDFGTMTGIPTSEYENPNLEINNANKRSIAVNLKTPEGHSIVEELLEKTDVLITNFRPGALKRLGMAYEDLCERYPRLVYGIVTGFGEEGPEAGKPGYDATAYWGRGGLMMTIGEPDAPPPAALPGFGDLPTGVNLALGVCAALLGRERTGKGDKVSAALYHSAIYNMGLNLASAAYGTDPRKSIKNPLSPMINTYQCKDGKWICLSATNYVRDWGTFCKSIGHEELAENPDYATFASMVDHRREITGIVAQAILQKDRDEWCGIWTQAGVPYEILLTLDEILTDEQALANDFVTPCRFRSGTVKNMPTVPVKLKSVGTTSFQNCQPLQGEHTVEVLEELGYSDTEIQALIEKQVVKAAAEA